MKLFLISQKENNGYDTFDYAVVAALDEEDAKNIIPTLCYRIYEGFRKNYKDPNSITFERFQTEWNDYNGWCSSPSKVNVEYIGEAVEGIQRGTICSSYNAG